MPSSANTTLVSHIDCPGGGQVWVEGTTLYIGHMRSPSGTTIVDVADPRNPKVIARLELPEGWHSHKVRVAGDIMIVNHEKLGQSGPKEFGGGIAIYDVSRPGAPKLISKWLTAGRGVHRYDFDGRYAYISPTAEGYVGNIVMILDLIDPARPVEVGRWWIPGQWTGGGEEYPWAEWVSPRCHHPIRAGDRLYVSYWHHGLFILDIADMARPRLVSQLNTSPSFPHPTHTCLPVPQLLKGRKIMVVADEDVAKLRPSPPAFTWIYDITEERLPLPIATFQVPGLDPDGAPQPAMTGCHQPSERFTGTVIPFAWFAQGLRLVDIADPFAPREVGHFLPDPPAGEERASSNDVTIDDRGLIYLIDRINGVDIIETSAF
ncbi:LVIVD repeat-containing protein [Inquilinus sp. NPDC058860]|uniref:LVIVD repeat-containing protein n=1 Tax=Inquilinus sp. NPDC058860 TaxID=3346652 RepID=UPI003678A4ED